MTFEPDYTDYYQLFCIHSHRPVIAEDMSVLCSLPAHVDVCGHIAANTPFISLVVLPADWRYSSCCDYLDMTYQDAGIFAHRQIGNIYKVVATDADA